MVVSDSVMLQAKPCSALAALLKLAAFDPLSDSVTYFHVSGATTDMERCTEGVIPSESHDLLR
jgi:hypothetical protein